MNLLFKGQPGTPGLPGAPGSGGFSSYPTSTPQPSPSAPPSFGYPVGPGKKIIE